jgi:hypothetical protein
MNDLAQIVLKNITSAILTLIGMAIVGLWLLFQPALIQFLLPLQAITIFGFGWLISMLALSLALTTAYAIYLRKQLKKKPFYACSVYWDDFFTPLCPSCEKALGNYAYYKDGSNHNRPGCRCFKCNTTVRFSDEEELFMTLVQAKEKAIQLYGGNKNKK